MTRRGHKKRLPLAKFIKNINIKVNYLKKNILILFLFFCALTLFGEPIHDKDFGFSLDIPEGFKVDTYTEDGMSYAFSHPNLPVFLAMKITSDVSYTSPSVALKQTLQKLNAQSSQEVFKWNDTICSISSFKMEIEKKYAGWAVATPTSVEGFYLVLLCYAPAEKEQSCERFIMSTLNSLCIQEDKYNTPGIITTFAFPEEGSRKINLHIGGKKISTAIDKSDVDAAQFVVDLEYSVLSLYSKHKLWKEAWKRYYRMIYRDSYERLSKVSSDIFDALYEDCKKTNPKNPEIAYAQQLLSWVQDFEYVRANSKNHSDFTCLPGAITGKGSDCDSRSLLICVLLKSIGIETLFLFSPDYSHAVAAADINAPGQKYSLDGDFKQYIFGETTAKVTWGMIAQDQADRKKWIPVILP